MTAEEDDEFFGDQSCDDEFGTAEAEFRDVKTVSYLDGFDETKEEKLQEGFAEGYSQSFDDAYQAGIRLGSIAAAAALCELNKNEASSAPSNKSGLRDTAKAIHQFLRDEVIDGGDGKEKESSYDQALESLRHKLRFGTGSK